ncbi:DUF1481 domain-containing protein [Salmonella enterica subsp. enterica]|nr:DUF1481 domain-containing protein [Salmonella enterica subsp. enterica]
MYRCGGDTLSLIELNIYSKPPEHIRARFDAHGELSFMQREVGGRSSFQRSGTCIAIAPNKSVRPVTPLHGGGSLRRGRWRDHTVTTASEGETLKRIWILGNKPH